MLHPWPQVSGYVEEEMDGDRGRRRCCGARSSTRPIRSRGFVRGYTLQFVRGNGPANEAITNLGTGRLPWGKDHHRAYRTLALPPAAWRSSACEDLPEEHNRVTLDPVLKDSHGIPAPKIDYTISENTRAMMEHGIARATEILEAAGAKNIFASRTVLNSPGHLLGTARMGTDPERSVVNEWGRMPRREEPLHRRWQHLGHLRRCEPDLHHPGAGALYRRQHEAAPRDALRLIRRRMGTVGSPSPGSTRRSCSPVLCRGLLRGHGEFGSDSPVTTR